METAIEKAQDAIVQQKRNAWANLGESIYKSDLKLQARAQQIIQKLAVVPANAEELAEAEATLKEAKATQKSIEADRKLITKPVDERLSQLMLAEKSLSEPITAYANAIIEVKKAEEERLAKERAKAEELKRAKEYVASKNAEYDARFKSFISERISIAYNHALGEGNVTPDKVEGYLKQISGRIDSSSFMAPIDRKGFQFLSEEEFLEILKEHPLNTEDYVKMWLTDLYQRFGDYEIAYNNKQQALEIAAKEEAERQRKIEEEKANKEAAAKLEAMAVTPTVSASFKELKKVYKIQMDETPENAIKILSAVVANWALCSQKIGVKKWFQFSVANAIVALEKVKNEDNKFQPAGIAFVETDKL